MPDLLAAFLGGFLGALIAVSLRSPRPIKSRFARLRLFRRRAERRESQESDAYRSVPLVTPEALEEWFYGPRKEAES